MTVPSFTEIAELISAANARRGWGQRPSAAASDAAAERRLQELFDVRHVLAVYGTLAPGRSNHQVVAPLGGQWTTGVIEGDFSADGWGTTLGYPAFRPRTGGRAIAAHVLTSPALAAAWPALDAFEGSQYFRILVPVFRTGTAGAHTLYTVANVYAAAAAGIESIGRSSARGRSAHDQ